MDWIDEKAEKLFIYIKNLSFRKAMVSYVVMLAGLVWPLSYITRAFCRYQNIPFIGEWCTPLTVIRGYTDFLAKYIPEGKLSQQKLQDTLRLMTEHLKRLEDYSRTMKGDPQHRRFTHILSKYMAFQHRKPHKRNCICAESNRRHPHQLRGLFSRCTGICG